MPAWASGRRPPRRRHPRFTGLSLALGVALVGTVLAYAMLPDVPVTPIAGVVERVVDGDTLDIAGQRIRLAGIDAPEWDQTCTEPDGGLWRCGAAATDLLASSVRGQRVACRPEARDRYDRIVATCSADGGGHGDLGEALVEAGLALGTDRYRSDEAKARERALGMWRGKFATPAQWRAGAGRDDQTERGIPSRFERLLAWIAGLFAS
jgi:endonuclease YncB( thermonuclease family)